ncbi:RHS repeat-associated core domain-containing protein [Rathayibacter toxicus]|uniref:RHS repeat-associated core domain-containing protein n=1 Tax=Rathayibacter toxicus TaxID=145458 RepID=UPI001C051A50|nr:RHS repeat-associated core domain-containing protein [Rathayibacter toxicus]QWL31893.1 hypothetical protein E2R35_02900 [Rathayibacter toxicus]QWL33986.1 hypothetical protein E2R36_02900 [Rathayibacter toxicus]QWL36118.1 hypothetical protein E2R37_02895 [Rathayibacter toxicus]QWL38209.1 hypothetical protein E2R38_02895 [Rathayibacter toxicus]QWL40298.1 hypothetical protein E2R39_02900 [Rathayibacter toxicus]
MGEFASLEEWGSAAFLSSWAGVPVGVSVTAGGGVAVAGVEWLGFRVYDPGTRGFLSVDPLEPVVGSGWVGNPYSYAGNDPLHAVDPWGLRPVTDEELRVYREGNNGVFAGAGKWLNDNKDYLFAAALVAVGVVAICSGVGGPVGLLLVAAGGGMVAAGMSVASQKSESGSVDWGKVGVDAAVGVVASGVAEGAVNGAATYSLTPGPHTVEGFVGATAENAAIGGVTAGMTAKMPPWLSYKNMKNFSKWVYRSGYTKEPQTLYRAGDIDGYHTGDWWSTDAPWSVSQVRADKALPLVWKTDDACVVNSGFKAEFPSGVPAYTGKAAPQTGFDGDYYPGGTNQTFIPGGRDIGKVVDSWPLAP